MANRNIEMNIKTESGYDVLYPLTTPQQAGSLPISGGTLTGPLYLSSSPSSSNQAATKQYVDNNISFNNSPFKVMDDITLSFVKQYGNNQNTSVIANLTADVDDILFAYVVISDFAIYYLANTSGRRTFDLENDYFNIRIRSDNPVGSPAFTDTIDGRIKFNYMADFNSSYKIDYKKFSISTGSGNPRVNQGTIRLVTIGLK